jgi:DNA polymerase I
MKLLCLDGNSILNRAFYGIKLLTTKDGKYTNAIFGFMNVLLKLEQDEKPDGIAIAFDLKGPTFRHELFDGYKATRHGMPEELAEQMPILKELLSYLGYKIVTAEGYEADDVLGTLAYVCTGQNAECIIATGDRDSYQLVNDNTSVLLTTTKFGKGETQRITKETIEETYKLEPKDLIQVKALQGDASDNIPGVKGVGEKTALALIQEFKTVENLYANIDSKSISDNVRNKLLADKENAEMSLVLARIAVDAPVPNKLAEYEKVEGNKASAAKLLSSLEMTTILNRLNLDEVKVEQEQMEFSVPEVKTLALTGNETGKLYISKAEGIFYATDEKVAYSVDEENESFLSVLQNGKAEKYVFDAKMLYNTALQHGCEAKGIVFDTKLAAYLLNPSAGEYKVSALAAEYEVKPYFESENAEISALPPLTKKMAELCEEQGMLDLLSNIELPLSKVLAEMEHSGFLVDAEGIKEFGKQLQAVLQSSLQNIYSIAGQEFNVNSPKQLGEILFVKLGLPPQKKTKSGFSTDAETLEALRGQSPIIEDILQYRTYQKLNSTYVEGLLKQVNADGRIHTVFNQTETRTGRISSNEPNLQNIPVRTELGRELRKFFVAPKGWVLLDADYSQIELRILAHISEDKAMIEAFENNEDIHRTTAARIFGLPPEMVTSQLRGRAKAVNFGIVYGIGAFSLSKDTGVTVKEADSFIKNYLEQFSGVKKYMDDTIAFGKEHGYVATLYGRRRALPELRSSNKNVKALGERLAMNTPIQGTAADIIKLAMVNVAKRLKEEKLRARLILQVHDELIIEAPIEEKDIASVILKEEMQGAAKLLVPLVADVNSGENWYNAKG